MKEGMIAKILATFYKIVSFPKYLANLTIFLVKNLKFNGFLEVLTVFFGGFNGFLPEVPKDQLKKE